MKLISALIAAGLTLGVATPALAATTGEAVTICKNEVTARYGDEAATRIHRIRSGKVTKVKLRVTGVAEKSFVVECRVDGKSQITSFDDPRNADLAAR